MYKFRKNYLYLSIFASKLLKLLSYCFTSKKTFVGPKKTGFIAFVLQETILVQSSISDHCQK